jgi:hypothetical protein
MTSEVLVLSQKHLNNNDSQAEEGEEDDAETESEGEGIDLDKAERRERVHALFDTEAAASDSDEDCEYYEEEENSQDRAFIASDEAESSTESDTEEDSDDDNNGSSTVAKLHPILKGGIVEATLKRVNHRLTSKTIKRRKRVIDSDSEDEAVDDKREHVAVAVTSSSAKAWTKQVVNPYTTKLQAVEAKQIDVATRIEKNRQEALKRLAITKAKKAATSVAPVAKLSQEVLLRIERNRIAALVKLAERRAQKAL